MKKFIRNLTKQKKSNAENQSISSKHSGRSCSTTSLDVGGYSVDVDTDDKSFTKLHKACWLGDYEKVKKHIKKNDVNLKDNYNRAPLHLAAVNGHNHIVLLLLEWNADPDVKDGDQKTPLIKAIENHHSEVAESLIHHGAKIEATDKDGNSPLLIALKNGQSDMAFALLGHGANVNVSNKERQTALHFATEKKLLGITKKLLEMGVSVDSADVYLRTPLMSACQTGFLPLVELILEHGADVTLKSNSGRTAEMFAKEEGHDAIVDILRSWGNKKPPKPEVKQQETDLPDAAGDNDSWNSDDSVVQEKPPIFPNLQTIVQMDDFQETVQLTPNAAKDNRSPENQDSANAVLSQVRQNLSQRPKKPTPSGQEELLEELGLSEGSDISSIKFDDSEISAQEEVKSKIKKSTSKISNKFDSSEEENQTSRKDDKPKETGAKPKLMVNVKTTKSKSDDDSYLDFSSEEDEEFMPSYVPSSLGNHNTSGGARKRTFSFDSDSNDVSAIPQHLQSTPKPISSLENVVKVNEAGNGAKDSVMHLRENIIVDKDVKKASSDANKGDDAHSIESWPTSSSESDEPDVQNKTLLSQIKENMTNKPEEKSTSLLKPESPGKKESSASSTLSGTLGKLGTLKAVEEIEESNAVLAVEVEDNMHEEAISSPENQKDTDEDDSIFTNVIDEIMHEIKRPSKPSVSADLQQQGHGSPEPQNKKQNENVNLPLDDTADSKQITKKNSPLDDLFDSEEESLSFGQSLHDDFDSNPKPVVDVVQVSTTAVNTDKKTAEINLGADIQISSNKIELNRLVGNTNQSNDQKQSDLNDLMEKNSQKQSNLNDLKEKNTQKQPNFNDLKEKTCQTRSNLDNLNENISQQLSKEVKHDKQKDLNDSDWDDSLSSLENKDEMLNDVPEAANIGSKPNVRGVILQTNTDLNNKPQIWSSSSQHKNAFNAPRRASVATTHCMHNIQQLQCITEEGDSIDLSRSYNEVGLPEAAVNRRKSYESIDGENARKRHLVHKLKKLNAILSDSSFQLLKKSSEDSHKKSLDKNHEPSKSASDQKDGHLSEAADVNGDYDGSERKNRSGIVRGDDANDKSGRLSHINDGNVQSEQINPESIFPTDVPPKKPPRRASLLHKTAEENKEVKKEVDGDNKEGLFGGDDTSTTVSDIHDGMGERKLSSDTLHSGDLQEELANSSNSFDDDDEDKSQSDDHLQLTSSLLSSPSKIGEIQTLLREYRLTIDKQKGESRALKSQVKSLSKENARLQRKVQEITSAKFELDQALLTAESYQIELRYKSQAESEQRSNAENLLKTLQQQVNVKEELYRREILAREEQSRTMKALENDFQGAQTLIKELKEKLLLLESELSNKDKTLQENEEHYNSLLKASEEASAKTKEATEERLTQIEEREKHLYEENKKLIEQFKSLKEETAKQMRAYQEKVNFLTSIKESLEQQLEETQKSIVLRDETLDRTSMEHTSQLITLKSENNKLKENLFNEQTAKKALENQVALLQQSLQELEQEKLERRQELCRLQQCLDVKEEELQRCREHSESETASLLKTNQQVLSQVSDLEKELGNAKSQLRQASKMYEEELKSLNKELSIAKETISAKDEILSSLEAELEEMKSLKRKALLELGNAKEENVVLTHKLETLEPKYISCQKERNHLQSNLDEAQAEIRSLIELKSKVQLLSSKTVELEHDYATMDAKYKGVLKENEHLRQELQHQRLQTESLEQKKKDTEESLMTSEKEIISLKADLNQTKQVKSNLERECHSLKEEVSVCKERLQITEAHLEGLKAEIQNVKFENIESQGSSSNEEVREIKDRLTETEKLVKQMAESMNGKKESSEKNFHAEPHLEHVKDVKEQLHQAERNLKVLSDNLHDIEGRMIGEGGKITSKETLGVHAHYPNMWNPKVDLQHPSSAALYHEQYGSMRGLLEDVAELKSHVKHMSNKIKELLDIHQLESRSSPLIEMAHIEEKLHDLQLQVQELTKHLRKEQDSNESHSDLDQHTVQTELLTLQKWQQELMIKVDTELKKLAAIQRKQVVWNESHEHRIWHELEALAVQELHHILGEFKMSFGQSMYTSTTKSYSQNAINDKQEQMEFLRAKNQLTQELSKLKSRITDDFGKRSQGHRSSTSSRSQKSFPSLEGQFQRKHTVKRPSALLHRKHNTKIASSTPIHTNSNFGNYMKWEPSPVTRKTSLLSHRINEETGSSQETSIKEIDDA